MKTKTKLNIPPTGQSETAHTLIGEYIVFVTIEHDTDCENPLTSCDGMGAIYSRSDRHNNHKSNDEIRELMEETPDAVRLSYYEHGLCRWDVAGTADYPDAQWDSVPFCGLWVPDKYLTEEVQGMAAPERAAKMAEYAQSACDVYTEWCNGNCHGYSITAYKARYEDAELYDQPDDYRKLKPIAEDSCWGFIGDDINGSVKEAARSVLASLTTEAQKKGEK